MKTTCLSHSELLQLKRWNTPTIYNGWEQITRHNAGAKRWGMPAPESSSAKIPKRERKRNR